MDNPFLEELDYIIKPKKSYTIQAVIVEIKKGEIKKGEIEISDPEKINRKVY
jgi:hypothetical protein